MSWNNSIKQRNKSLNEKFWEKVIIKSKYDCWEWQASRNKKGYGNFYISIGHSKDKHCLAHRMAYKLIYGDIPDGLQVLHHCDNPSCVNPNHLFIGTNDDNVKDKMKKGRHCDMKGENHPSNKLTENDVLEIRRLRTEENLTYFQLADLYQVHYSTIGYIIKRKLWSHVN